MRACLFQTSERGRLAALIRSAATSEEQRALLESHAPAELAIQAATAHDWDRCSYAACFGTFLESRVAPTSCVQCIWSLQNAKILFNTASLG